MGLLDALLKAMIWWAVLFGISSPVWLLVGSIRENVNSHAQLDANGSAFCTQLIFPMGYPCEEHQAVTADGYVLAVHRIAYGAMGKLRPFGQPIFLQHGFMGGGDQWVLDSPQQSLAFILADSGFDVWIGNLRGNRWSTGHVSLTTQDKKYWEWSWDEHATFDIPAMLQLVFNQTGSRAKYIGHSQGTTVFLAALSQSSVTQFVNGAALLSPIAHLSKVTSILAKTLARIMVDKLVFSGLGVEEFNVNSGVGKRLLHLYCSLRVSDCVNLITELSGPNCCIDFSRLPFYTLYEPQSTSTKNIAHLLQMIRTGKFNKFDYGGLGNLQHYGQLQPPTYNLSRISQDFSMLLAYGGKDALADESDVQYLVTELPCHPRILHLPQYAHADFVLGTSANKDLYEPIINFFLGK